MGFALALLPATTVPPIGDAYAPTSTADNNIGQQQVERLWADFAKPDLAALDFFAPNPAAGKEAYMMEQMEIVV